MHTSHTLRTRKPALSHCTRGSNPNLACLVQLNLGLCLHSRGSRCLGFNVHLFTPCKSTRGRGLYSAEQYAGAVCDMGQPEGITFYKQGTDIFMLLVGEPTQVRRFKADPSCTAALNATTVGHAALGLAAPPRHTAPPALHCAPAQPLDPECDMSVLSVSLYTHVQLSELSALERCHFIKAPLCMQAHRIFAFQSLLSGIYLQAFYFQPVKWGTCDATLWGTYTNAPRSS